MRYLVLMLLIGLLVTGCLGTFNKTFSPKKFETTAVNTETNVLQTAYETSSYRATPNGFYEQGILKIKNSGNTRLQNLQLKIRVKKMLSPAEQDVINHAKGMREREIRIIQSLTIKPNELFIEELQPHESQNVSIDIIGFGEGNFYGIDVINNNKIIFGIQGFVPYTPISTSKDFTAEELADMPPEMLAGIVPKDVLERFTAEELAGFTSDMLVHIVPSKFPKPKNESSFGPFKPSEPVKLPVTPDEGGR